MAQFYSQKGELAFPVTRKCPSLFSILFSIDTDVWTVQRAKSRRNRPASWVVSYPSGTKVLLFSQTGSFMRWFCVPERSFRPEDLRVTDNNIGPSWKSLDFLQWLQTPPWMDIWGSRIPLHPSWLPHCNAVTPSHWAWCERNSTRRAHWEPPLRRAGQHFLTEPHILRGETILQTLVNISAQIWSIFSANCAEKGQKFIMGVFGVWHL